MSVSSSEYDFDYQPPSEVVFSLRRHLRSVRVLSREAYHLRRAELIDEFCSLVGEVLGAVEFERHIDEDELEALPWVLSDAFFFCRRRWVPHSPRMARAGTDIRAVLDSVRLLVHPDRFVPDWAYLHRMPSILDSSHRLHRLCDPLAVSLRQRRLSCRAISTHLTACLDYVYSADLPLWVVKWTSFLDLVVKVVVVAQRQPAYPLVWRVVCTSALDYIEGVDSREDPYLRYYVSAWEN